MVSFCGKKSYTLCTLSAYKENVFHPWEIAFTLFNVYSAESVRDTSTLHTHLGICHDQRDLTALYHIAECLPSCNSQKKMFSINRLRQC
ncbi:hypothetical protein QYF36_024482 [Acer negundo]|nr:hypothetical protein QYF36_024482 [Acer negundo]